MPEFWELCTPGSKAILGYLYKQDHGHWPYWDERSGEKVQRPLVTMSPEVEEEYRAEIARFMSQAPEHQKRVE